MDHVEIINAILAGDVLHIRDMAEAERLGRPAEAVLADAGRVAMAHALRAARSPLLRIEPQGLHAFSPPPDGVCYVAA